jgi:alkylation response protein AidB-like acyl-CoA dehydrogenase
MRRVRRRCGWIGAGADESAPMRHAAACAAGSEPVVERRREVRHVSLRSGLGDESAAPEVAGAEVDALLDRGAAFTAAEMLGGAARAMDMAVEYAKDRVQFGRPIGSFQAVKHRCADMLVDVEGMRSSAYWAAWCIGAGHEDASVAASTAKIWCSDASKRVMASALQVHGGIGFTWEHDLHLFLKRAQLDQVSFGDAAFHRQRLADLLRPRVEAGESVI